MAKTFLGYRRANGAVGVRNWVAVISIMDNCNPVTRAIAHAVEGTIPVTTLFVRGQIGCGSRASRSIRSPEWEATRTLPPYC